VATGTTNDFNYTRDQIINAALRKVGALAVEDVADAARLQEGIRALNGILRALDLRNPNIWKILPDPVTVALSANDWRYTVTANVLEIVQALYRDSSGQDRPLKVLNAMDYALLHNKLETGEPEAVFLPSKRELTATNELFIWPALASVSTTSVVTGTDAAAWSCIRAHTADSTNRPITGDNYLQYWTSGGSSPSAWATSTSYTAAETIRLVVKTPLADFDLATDNADLPSGFGLYLIYRLANDWSDDFGLPLEERLRLRQQMKDAYDEVFPYHIGASTNYHNRVKYT
jgi:hypothetical protein